jgi:hypothetical protein
MPKPISSAASCMTMRTTTAFMVMPTKCSEADLLAACMDITMMNMGGKEKTEENFVKILTASGLKLVKIWRAAAGPQAVIEACLAVKPEGISA